MKYDIGLIGLGVMGKNLARNLASRRVKTLVFNRHTEKAEGLIKDFGNSYLDYRKDYASFILDLHQPRKIILMVQAGPAVDEVVKNLRPHLSKGDILIDAGNSYYKDTIQRCQELKKSGLEWVGLGVSGGEEGALHGPSLMPGCEPKTWKAIAPIFKKIAAKDFQGGACVTHVGTNGAGHFIKMVHNGIEYAIMQIMAEAYDLFRTLYGLSANEIAAIFKAYNQGKLQSYLFEIAVPVLTRKDEFHKGNLIDFILDKAGQKGTGRLVAADALEQGLPLPTITLAVFARSLSSFKEQRVTLASLVQKTKYKPALPLTAFAKSLEGALYASILSSYAQGFEHIKAASVMHQWKINLAEITRIWEGGCIIRARLLNFLHRAFNSAKGKTPHLFQIPSVRKAIRDDRQAWRQVVAEGIKQGVPVGTLASGLDYFESVTSANLPANLIQGLRDYFGAHTYQRTDRPGNFHTSWSKQ